MTEHSEREPGWYAVRSHKDALWRPTYWSADAGFGYRVVAEVGPRLYMPDEVKPQAADLDLAIQILTSHGEPLRPYMAEAVAAQFAAIREAARAEGYAQAIEACAELVKTMMDVASYTANVALHNQDEDELQHSACADCLAGALRDIRALNPAKDMP